MINTTYFLALFLIFLRIVSFFSISKIFFPKGTPNTLKVVFSLIFSFGILTSVDYASVNNIVNNYYLITYMVFEVSNGLILGIISNIAFEIVLMAGSLLDLHIGLSMVNTIDPNSETSTTISGNLLHYIALIIFFVINGHHMIIKSLIESFLKLPIGNNLFFQDTMMTVIEIIANYFVIGLKIAIPIVLIIILTDICMGLISRAVPQINVMILGMPIKMLVGIIAIVFSLPIIIKLFVNNISYLPSIFRKIITTIPILFFIASDDKTEEATPKKKSDSRKKGQVPKSKDIGLVITLIAITLVIITLSGFIVTNFKNNIIYFLGNINSIDLTDGELKQINLFVLSKTFIVLMPVILPIMIAGVVASLIQTGFLIVEDALKPNFGKLNPINGFKNMFSKKALVELLKNLILITVVIYIAYSYIKDNFNKIMQIGNIYLPSLGVEIKGLITGIFIKICIFLIVVAVIDYIVQYILFQKEIRMSKQEVKEEYKQMEGDPQIKSKIKQKQREISQRRMMESVKDATVVITNPTHLAVAIKYTEGEMKAPKLLAKGADNIALKIKEKALENKIPVIENKPLARLIYESVDIEKEIPQEMYQAVAEVLAMVYKLEKNKKGSR